MKGKTLRRDQVLDWYDQWSVSDRRRVEAALARIPDAVCKEPPYGGIVAVWAEGRRAAVIHPGWIEWPQARWSTDLPEALFPAMQTDAKGVVWHIFDAFQERGQSQPGRDRPEEICPRCFLALPATGVCDNCG